MSHSENQTQAPNIITVVRKSSEISLMVKQEKSEEKWHDDL